MSDTATKYSKHLPSSMIMLIACTASELGWWWWRGAIATGRDQIDTFVSYLSVMFWFPGWFIVTGFDNSQVQLATKTTDILIPLVSGIIWGLFGLLALKSSRLVMKYVHRPRNS
jgi:hypothetical protein